MSVFGIRSLALVIVSSAVPIAAISCARRPDPSLDPMRSTGWCDTTPMKPIGRRAEVPNARALTQFGAVTGTVVQAETGDALQGAVVNLVRITDAKDQSQPWRGTDSKGAFTFDSIMPGRYQLRVRRVGEYYDTLTIQPVAGRVDTVRLRMRAYRCYGY